MSNKEDDEIIEDLVVSHGRTVDAWLKKGRTIGEAYAEANREARQTIAALIRQSQSTLLRRVGEEVLKDESLPNNPLGLPKVQYEKRVLRNMLRADQRKALQAIIKEIEAPNQSGEG
jgi:hypothetical protein